MFREVDDIKAFIMTKITAHEQNLDFSDPKDFIDCFLIRLKQVQKGCFFSFLLSLLYTHCSAFTQTMYTIPVLFLCVLRQEKHNPDTEFHKDNMLATVVNLFVAGTETTSTTIRYALMMMIKHPHIQGMFVRCP